MLFGIPNDEEQRMEHAIEIPRLSSLILKHDLDAPLAGLDTVAPENRPPVRVVFWTFRVMVGLGFLMLLLGACSLLARAGASSTNGAGCISFALVMGPAGFVAVIAGWMTTEVGRQPFTIYNVLRTAESASPLAAPAVATSLIAFVIVYFAVFGMGTWYLLGSCHARPIRTSPICRTRPRTPAGITPGPALRGAVARRRSRPWLKAPCSPISGPRMLAFAVFMYVVMDGFDLGIGILFPVFGVGRERDTAMNSIAPVWDGNETWLVLGGGGLLAAFPLAYSIMMSALYPPLIAMLLALVFRGVAFEFRWRDPAHRAIWDFAFTAGSFVAAFTQGVMLGALLQGISVEGRAYGGGWWDWLTPFSLLTGASVVAGYCLLGACWLNWKTDGETQKHARRLMRILAPVTLVCILAVSVSTPFLGGEYCERWFSMPRVLFTAQVPLVDRDPHVAFRAQPAPQLRPRAVRHHARGVRRELRGPRHQHVSVSHPEQHHAADGRGSCEQPGIHAGGRGRARAADPRLHRVVILGVPRQGRARGIPLSRATKSPKGATVAATRLDGPHLGHQRDFVRSG